MADTDRSEPPTLLSIPVEMQKAIADVTDNEGLLALRLVNMELKEVVDDSFLERFFTTRLHAVTLFGLAALLQISMRPHLTRKLKEIILARFEPDFYPNNPPSESLDDPELLANLMCDKWREEMGQLFFVGRATSILTRALKNINGRAPKLSIANGFWVEDAPIFGRQQLAREFKVVDGTLCLGEDAEEVQSLLAAIDGANYPVRDLELFVNDENNSCLLQQFAVVTRFKNATCWRSLKSLSLDLPGHAIFWEKSLDRHLAAFIKVASGVTSFELRLSDTEGRGVAPDGLKSLGKAFQDHTLQQIKLCGAVGFEHDFIALLLPHQSSLKAVTLIGDALRSGCWSRIFACLHESFRIEHLKIEHLQKPDCYGWSGILNLKGRVSLNMDGEMVVKEGLQSLVASLEYYD